MKFHFRPFRPRRPLAPLLRDERGVSALEFALVLPMFLAFVLSGLEISSLALAHLKVQRTANMAADYISLNGLAGVRYSEANIYDILSSISISAQPIDLESKGRIILTSVVGEDANGDGKTEVNRIMWQRFGGRMTEAVPIIGCATQSTVAKIANNRMLRPNEALYQAQVSYRYEPLIAGRIFMMFDVPTTITRHATYRGRGPSFNPILSAEGYTPKTACNA